MKAAEPFQIPRSDDAEQAVIGGLMLDNGAIDRMGDLPAEAFFRAENRAAYATILSLIQQNKPADVLTVADACREVDMVYLHQIAAAVPSAANIARYADMVREKALMRGVLAAAGTIQELVTKQGLSAAEILDQAQTELTGLSEKTVKKEPASINEAMTRYLSVLDERFAGTAKTLGMPTGLSDLDKFLNGGLRRGALITIGARPGMGKSALGETIGCNMALDYSVLFLSMEMPETEVTERAVANWGKVSATKLATADKSMTDDDWSRITVAAKKAQDSKLFIDDQAGLSLLEVVTKARGVKRKHGLDVLIVDYLQLMVGGEEKRYQQIESITKGLKVLAKTLNIAVVALSQFSRDIEKRPNPRPKPSDFRDGGSIEQDSDILIGLHREEQDKPDDQSVKGFAELFVMKNRQGKTGQLCLTYLGDFMRFENHSGAYPDRQPVKQKKGFY